VSEVKFDDKLKALFETWTKRMAEENQSVQQMRDMHEAWHTMTLEPVGVSYEDVNIDGINALWCIPANENPEVVGMYFHAGAFIVGSTMTHRKVAGHIARALGGRVLVVDFRLAPEHVYPAQLEDAVTAFKWLVQGGYAADNIVSIGDSAGGTLALALVEKLRQLGEPIPGAVFAISAGLDWEVKWMVNEENDAMVSKEVMASMSSLFIGNESVTDPLVNPIYADLAGYPPVYLAVGGHENLLGSSREFVERAKVAGVDVILDVGHERQHVYTISAGNDPEADRTIAAFGAWIRTRVNADR
jgi:acetyl esterase/lipase